MGEVGPEEIFCIPEGFNASLNEQPAEDGVNIQGLPKVLHLIV
jgi:hypothetical protein